MVDQPTARDLYFEYVGSQFLMSRNGVDALYRSFDVPEGVEKRWFDELVAIKLEELGSEADHMVVWFFAHHSLYEYFDRVLAAVPCGRLNQKTAFYETLIAFARAGVKAGALSCDRAWEAHDRVVVWCEVQMRRARSERTRYRLHRLKVTAGELCKP